MRITTTLRITREFYIFYRRLFPFTDRRDIEQIVNLFYYFVG